LDDKETGSVSCSFEVDDDYDEIINVSCSRSFKKDISQAPDKLLSEMDEHIIEMWRDSLGKWDIPVRGPVSRSEGIDQMP